jgi:DNA-binding NtrC family response regulator
MSRPLAMLMIEDSAPDAELVLHVIIRGGFTPSSMRVNTAPALRGALLQRRWDLITCDWIMPTLTAPEALDILREAEVDCPVIIVSGEVAEEVAVTAMKNGAHDFVSKHNLARLVPAIERELREADDRRARRRVEGELRTERQRLALAVETSNTGLWDWYPCTRETFLSARWKAQSAGRDLTGANERLARAHRSRPRRCCRGRTARTPGSRPAGLGPP